MSESFEIALSMQLAPEDIAAAVVGLIAPGLRVDIRSDMADLPDEPGGFWAYVAATDDPAWPCSLNVLSCGEECGLGPYPDLCIAARLWEIFGTNSLCSTYPFVGELDPDDPYWSLACIKGGWFLTSTAGSRLMGPYTDGVSEFPGDGDVRLIRAIAMPD